MPFDYVDIYIGNDEHNYAGKYDAQVPVKLQFKITTTQTVVRYLKWSIYWYEGVSGESMQRKEKTMTLTYTTGTQVFTVTAYVTQDELNIHDYTVNLAVTGYPKLVVTLMDNLDHVLETDEYQFNINGKTGKVNWIYPFPAPSFEGMQYPTIGITPSSIITALTDYVSDSSGCPPVWRENFYSIQPGNWAKLMLYRNGSGPMDLAVAADSSHGYIPNTWTINSYVWTSPNLKLVWDYRAELSLTGGFLKEGDYRIAISYYEKNGTEPPHIYTWIMTTCPEFRIYKPFAGAAFHISSVVPSKYQEGSTDPLDGKPPFTVTIADDTVRDEYTVPLEYITIDWDDPQSSSGAWTISNPGTATITIPPHVYTDSRTHNIQMICKDKNENITTVTVQFSPSQEPRIISPPTVTYDGTEAPVLVTGTIDVAGVPLPEITWTYALRNGDPEYYAGEKKGEYTEFSLLAGGTYDITCKAMNGEVTLGFWDDWHPTITEPTPTPDTPVSANNFDIWVYQNGQRVDVIKPTRCQYVDRLAHSSYCEFDVPMDYRNISLLMPGAEIAVGYLGKARYMMVTEFSEDSLGEYCSVTAMDAATVALQNRIATVATHSLSDGGYDVQTCSAERLLRYFAVSNIRSGNRVVPRFRVVGTNQDRGGKVTYSARYEPILTIMEEICTQSGLGWESSLQSDSSVIFSFKVIGGVDHTAGTTNPVIFTERENGLRSAQVSAYHGMLGSNLVIAAGKGEGDTRVQYQDYGATTVSDIQRREVFLDASDSATDYEVQCAAETELARQDEQTITIYPNEQVYKFGVDYNLGDYVTVITKSGMQLNLQIHQANMSLDDTGVNLSLECGTDIRDYQRLIQRNKFENTYARK